jgi:hypothetical protein
VTGSPERSSETDERCPHCGLFYSKRGIHSHRRNCEWSDYPGRVHPEAASDPEDVDEQKPNVPRKGPLKSEGDLSGVREGPHPEGVGGEGTPPSGDGEDPERATDGGPRAPPEPDVDVDEKPVADEDVQEVDDDDVVECPACGGTNHFPASLLPDEVLEALPDRVDGSNRVCYQCSVDDAGELQREIEVVDA